jgi:deazaflavin-dependent oxidoreductase (nitroreductase family)
MSMALQKLPAGSRGARQPPGFLGRIFTPLMIRIHRRSGNRFQGLDLVYLTTVGARSGQRRTTPVARFDDGGGGWIVVASAGGTANHPAWYHNIVAHPDQVWAEVGGKTHRVAVDQLEREERERAWAVVVARAPRFQGYTTKTDRVLPVLRLTPVP